MSVYGLRRLSGSACGIQVDRRNRPVEPSRTWSWKSLTMTTSLRPSPSMSWIWNGRIRGQEPVARVGPAQLPEHLAVEGHGRQATDLDEVVADPGDVLGDEHLGHAVAVEVAEQYAQPNQ